MHRSSLFSLCLWAYLAPLGNGWAAPGQFTTDFSSSLFSNATLYGAAVITNGALDLTPAETGKVGAWIIEDFNAAQPVSRFIAQFTALVGGGTGADGFSLNFAPDLPNTAFDEEGTGSGLVVSFDSYDNGGGEAPAISVKLAGRTIARRFAAVRTGNSPVAVRVELRPDGRLDVSYNNQSIFANLVTGYEPLRGRFGFGARTGSFFDLHRIDNLDIKLFGTAGPPTIVLPPTNQTVFEQREVAFRVGVDGTAPYFFQWRLNGVPIPGATNAVYKTVATLTGSGAGYSCQITTSLGSVTTGTATLSVQADTTRPTVTEVSGDPSFRRLRVRFSERVSAATAGDANNYSVSGLNILSATFSADGTNVSLTTSPQTPGTSYSLSVMNVRDLAYDPNTINPGALFPFTSWLLHPGLVQVAIYQGLESGSAVSLLTTDPKYPDRPDVVYLTNRFSSVRNFDDLYGVRIWGYFTLPGAVVPGPSSNVMFYARGDDEFAVNRSATDDPLNAVRIIDATVCCEPFAAHSSTIFSVSLGHRFYLEGLLKENGGGDFLDVGVSVTPSGVAGIPPTNSISAIFLSTAGNPDTAGSLTITKQPEDAIGTIGHATTFSVMATNSLRRPVFVQWQAGRNGVFTNIPAAVGPSFTTPLLTQADSGQSFRAVTQVPGRIVNSSEALLLITQDHLPPELVSVASVNQMRANLRFNERLDPATATSSGNYSVLASVVIGAVLRPDQESVELILAEPVPSIFVTVNNVRDVAGNRIASNTTAQGPVWARTTILGAATAANSVFSSLAGDVEVAAGGHDIWSTSDEFQFVYQMRTNDFDVQVRVESFEGPGPWAKAGLMMRNALTPTSATIQAYATPAPPDGAGVYETGYRPADGSDTFSWATAQPFAVFPNAWVRLRRVGKEFSAFYSPDGESWTQYASLTDSNSFNQVVFVGLATTANAAQGLAQAHFRDFGFLTEPSIVNQPQSQTVNPGTTIVLSVEAGGVVPIRYQWRLNGVNIPGATNNTYVIVNSTPQDGGRYTAVVIGPNRVVESQPAIVIVSAPHFAFSDSFAGRPTFSTSSGLGRGNNLGATLETYEPPHGDRVGGSSVWFTWTAPFSGPVSFSTRGSTYDTLLAVYQGTALQNLVRVIDDDDRGGFATSLVRFNAVANMVYQLAIDGVGGAQGQIVLSWDLRVGTAVPVVVKHPSNHVVLLGQSVTLMVTVQNASTIQWMRNGVLIPSAFGNSLTIQSVTRADVGLYQARVTGLDGQTFIDSRPGWIELGPFPSAITYDKFEALYRPLSGGGAGGGGNTSVGVPVTAGSTSSQVLNNFNSTTQAGEPNHCGQLTGATRWYGPLFTTTNGLSFEIDTIGSGVDTILASYIGDDLLTVSNVDCAVGPGSQSTVRFPAMPNQRYDIAVDGVGGAIGEIVLNYRLGSDPVWSSLLVDQLARPGDQVEFTASAVGVPAPSYQWYTNGVAVVGETGTSFVIPSAQAAHAGVYMVMASNFMGTVSTTASLTVGTAFDFEFKGIVTNGANALLVVGPTNDLSLIPYVIEASFDFDTWDPIWTNASPEIRTNFLDPNRLLYPYRFYRAVPKEQ